MHALTRTRLRMRTPWCANTRCVLRAIKRGEFDSPADTTARAHTARARAFVLPALGIPVKDCATVHSSGAFASRLMPPISSNSQQRHSTVPSMVCLPFMADWDDEHCLEKGPSHVVTTACPQRMRRAGAWTATDFELGRSIGSGKASSVYKATCLLSGCVVAVKVYHKVRAGTCIRVAVSA